ncbi:Integrase catalytic domain-containing protein, partial [Aphis craccivora]
MLSAANERPDRCRVLLSTVAILVQDVNGDYQEFRALIDGASESSYMTEVCERKLGLTRQKCNLVVRGMSDVQVASIKSHVNLNLRPVRSSTPEININAYVVPRITGLLPSKRVWKAEWNHLKGLELADPRYDEPMPIDILLGADVVPYVTRSGRREGTGTEPVGLETVFGWTLMGNTGTATIEKANTFHQTPENIKCEELYTTTTARRPDGRYVVHLPFIQNPPHLGESRAMATLRLHKLEIRLEKSEELRQQYNVAMRDYLDVGHMKPVDSTETMTSHSYYTPHHVVLKPESLTTKVRVVYDASAVTSNGKSLNDCLFPGPKLQQDLSGILVRFRLHSIVFTVDIRQMFRQIDITAEHHAYQRLLYRFQPTDPVQVFEMTTVTFGQRSSPFLAIRTLHQLAADEAANHPEVQKVIYTDLFVDDVAIGTKCEESALRLQQDLINVFKRGGFDLRKWSNNSIALLEAVPPEHRQTEAVTFDEPTSDYTKVLGLKWEPKNDTIAYQYQPNPVRYSKRAILSEIARIYDPIGILTPVITNLKRLMKYLWALRIGLDDDLPVVAKEAWTRYHDELPFIASVCVARRITVEDANCELHGFCDSSESSYAAAAYLLARTSNGQIQVHLLMGKSKVSPEKKLSIPRLELCGALLLARTIDYLRSNLKSLPIDQYYAWTDSMVTLVWINTLSANLKTFVGNRVARIQELTSQKIWRYVPSVQNPVDCASRGLTPSEIVDHPLWWNGPTFLRQPLDNWPQQANMSDTDLVENQSEEKLTTLIASATTTQLDENCAILYASSELSEVLRLAAYWLRLRQRLGRPPRHIHFAEDWNCLRQNRPCTPKLCMLGAYLDLDSDLIRVGGRLKNSYLPYESSLSSRTTNDAEYSTPGLLDLISS